MYRYSSEENGDTSSSFFSVVSRSDIVLSQPNGGPAQYMPLGNGRLGAAVWAAGGFTAQLNRADTFPDRKSPGQVVIPGLAKLTSASDFTGRLDLYDGVLTESGGAMTMTARVLANTDELVVDVTGADPNTTQTADVHLWSGRLPVGSASGAIGTLAEITDGRTGAVIVQPTSAATFTLNVQPGHTYLIEQPSAPTTALAYAPVTGTAPAAASHLGQAEIGLPPAVRYSSLAASFDDVAVRNDNNTAPGTSTAAAPASPPRPPPRPGPRRTGLTAPPLPGTSSRSPVGRLLCHCC